MQSNGIIVEVFVISIAIGKLSKFVDVIPKLYNNRAPN